jgi:hypothetical protein
VVGCELPLGEQRQHTREIGRARTAQGEFRHGHSDSE